MPLPAKLEFYTQYVCSIVNVLSKFPSKMITSSHAIFLFLKIFTQIPQSRPFRKSAQATERPFGTLERCAAASFQNFRVSVQKQRIRSIVYELI